MMSSQNKVISGMLFKTYTGIAEYEEDHHSYRWNFFTVPNHTCGHSPISTASISRTMQFIIEVLDIQYVYAPHSFQADD